MGILWGFPRVFLWVWGSKYYPHGSPGYWRFSKEGENIAAKQKTCHIHVYLRRFAIHSVYTVQAWVTLCFLYSVESSVNEPVERLYGLRINSLWALKNPNLNTEAKSADSMYSRIAYTFKKKKKSLYGKTSTPMSLVFTVKKSAQSHAMLTLFSPTCMSFAPVKKLYIVQTYDTPNGKLLFNSTRNDVKYLFLTELSVKCYCTKT